MWDKVAETFQHHRLPLFTRRNLTFTSLAAANTRATYLALMERLSEHLSSTTRKEGSFRVLKSDLWNEGIDSSKGNLSEFTRDLPLSLETFGGDISPKVCRLANEKRIIGNIVCCDVGCLPFCSKSLDIVLDMSTIDHVKPSAIHRVVKEYSRILRKGGVLLLAFDTTSIPSKLQRAILRMIAPRRSKLSYPPYHWLINPKIMRTILKDYYSILSEHSILMERGILMLLQQILSTRVNNAPLRTSLYSWRFTSTLLQNLRRFELSRWSKYMEVIASQHVFLCART